MAIKTKKTKNLGQVNMADVFDWKQAHGGKRAGSGRPSKGIETKTIRVPVDLIPEVKKLIEDYKRGLKHD